MGVVVTAVLEAAATAAAAVMMAIRVTLQGRLGVAARTTRPPGKSRLVWV
jgi:hypothetical protein